jgi:hypothetical protein
VTSAGPAGNVFQADLNGSSLSNVFDMAVDFLGNTCSSDNGIRSLKGTINSSNQVTLNFDVGGSFTVTINGTLNSSGLPSFCGTGTVSGLACASNSQTVPITGVLAVRTASISRAQRFVKQQLLHLRSPSGPGLCRRMSFRPSGRRCRLRLY